MPADPVIILSVLRSGGDFKPEHVLRLQEQCARWAPGVGFACLSDVDIPGVSRFRLERDWPGWWAKMEMFRLPGPVLYMDLDTTVVGSLSPLLKLAVTEDFVALRDFNPAQREMGSGLMAWSGKKTGLFASFKKDAEGHMRRCTTSRSWGDQGFLEPLTRGRKYWQHELPGMVVSYKKHCLSGVPAGARVVCHHGKPRPWEVA